MSETAVKIEHMDNTVEVFMDGDKVAESKNALMVYEVGQNPMVYIPKNDLKNIDLIKSNKVYHCPHKGEADFFTVVHGENFFENAVWAYDRPFKHLANLEGHVAFYPDQIESLIVLPY